MLRAGARDRRGGELSRLNAIARLWPGLYLSQARAHDGA
jgi:hypothetical protein